MPLSPVHPRGTRQAGGDIALRFVRRGRIEADGWTEGEIPLHEADERYRVEILDGATVRRSIELNAPHFLYGAAEQVADFGTLQSVLSLRIRQLGRLAAGRPLEAVVAIQ